MKCKRCGLEEGGNEWGEYANIVDRYSAASVLIGKTNVGPPEKKYTEFRHLNMAGGSTFCHAYTIDLLTNEIQEHKTFPKGFDVLDEKFWKWRHSA